METRRLIFALSASMLVFMVWMVIGPKIMPTPPQRDQQQASSQPTSRESDQVAAVGKTAAGTTSRPAETKASAAMAAASTPSPSPQADAAKSGKLQVVDEVPRQVVIGDDDPNGPYNLMLTLSSRGASLNNADLTPILIRYRNYPSGDPRADLDKDDDPHDSYDLLRPLKDDRTGASFDSLATQTINVRVDGNTAVTRAAKGEGKSEWQSVDLADKHWSVKRRREEGRNVAIFKCTIRSAGKDMLGITKTYTLDEGTCSVRLDLKVESLDGKPHEVILTQRGPLNIHQQNARAGDSRKIYYAIKAGDEITTGKTERKETVADAKDESGSVGLNPVSLPGPDTEGNLLWAALGNQYFAVIMTPVNAEGIADSSLIEDTQVIHLTNNAGKDENSDLTFRFVGKSEQVKPDSPFELLFDVYVGPKERSTFSDAENYATYAARKYVGTIHEEYYWCVWMPLADLMTNLLIGLHDYIWPHNWGLAIIILVLVVRVILHPVTKKGQVSMAKMQSGMAELQPKLEEIKKRCGGDRAKINQETMALYKKEGVNPASNIMSCLPMMLQMPIWVALWATLSNTIELRHAGFEIIPGRWILDLAAPDALYRFAEPVRLMFFEIDAINLLPPLWGLSMVLQQKLTPKPKTGKSSEQQQQQAKMMYIMAVVFTVMFYSFPSGLTMYIMASNFFGLIEQWRIRKHLEDEDKGGKSAPPPSEPRDPNKPKGLAASLMDKFNKFDKEQRSIKGKR